MVVVMRRAGGRRARPTFASRVPRRRWPAPRYAAGGTVAVGQRKRRVTRRTRYERLGRDGRFSGPRLRDRTNRRALPDRTRRALRDARRIRNRGRTTRDCERLA